MAKNVRSNRIDLADNRYMPIDLESVVSRNRLSIGDVLVTRTGANFGQAAPWKRDVEAYACADILILREPILPSGYLSSFLESKIGKPLMLRGGYGAGQPHIAPPYLANMLIPRLGLVEERIDHIVNAASAFEEKAVSVLDGAGATLLTALGLVDWEAPEPLTYEAKARDALAAGRLDARFFAPRIQALLDMLSSDGRTIASVAKPRREKFQPEQHVMFDYIEISDMDGAGTTRSTRLLAAEAPSRATWHVRGGDIITSSIRPIRRLSAQIMPKQAGFVCSSGFVVIKPETIAPEVLLTYLRLPVICELLDLYASASMYPAITDADIFNLPLPEIPDEIATQIVLHVQNARIAKTYAAELLEMAKRAVEIAIEDSEQAALQFLAEPGDRL